MGVFRIEKILAAVILTAWATAGEKTFIENKVNLAVGLMVVAMTIAAVMSPYQSVLDNREYYDWMKAALLYLLMMTLIKSEKELKFLLTTMIISWFLYMGHSYYEFHCGRGSWQQGVWKIIGVDGSDANTFGMRCNYMVPFLFPFAMLLKKKWHYLFILAYLLLFVRVIQLTGSRTSFLMLILFAITAGVLSKHRVKIIPALLIGAAVGWATLDESQKERYRTIWDSSAGAGHTQTYADGRLAGFYGGLEVFMTSPIWGVGPGCYRFTPVATGYGEHKGAYTHFLYGQIPSNIGLLGILGWSSMLVCVGLNHMQIRELDNEFKRRKLENESKFVAALSYAIMLSFFLLLFGGFAGHNAFNWNWLWYPAFQGVGLYVLQQKMIEVKKAESLSAAVEKC